MVLSFSATQGNYIKTLPLHASQKVIVDNEKELRVEMFVHVTFDLVKAISSYANDVKVMAPASLKKEICKKYKDALQQYN